uniref:Group II intron maturase-specific domain-containing protein n=1 Tax=Rhodogorgon sp. TaxID=2485824 RepID=A0A3G3MIK1_9FLOR|nr:hypothetical protein [Rhodogorgon sp.]
MLKTLYCNKQETRNKEEQDLRELQCLKKEILIKYTKLKVFLLRYITNFAWPILKYERDIYALVQLRQRYFILLSRKYGLRAIQIEKQWYSWIGSLDMRIFSIGLIYRLRNKFIYGIHKLFFKKRNLLILLPNLKISNLLSYKNFDSEYICNFEEHIENFNEVKIFTIKDYIIQILFFQILNPIINNSIYIKKLNYYKTYNNLNMIKSQDYVEKLCKKCILVNNIDKIYNKVSCKQILTNFPLPKRFIKLLYNWVFILWYFQSEFKNNLFFKFPENIIDRLINNFVLEELRTFLYLKGGILLRNYNEINAFNLWEFKNSSFVNFKSDFVMNNIEVQLNMVNEWITEFNLIFGLEISFWQEQKRFKLLKLLLFCRYTMIYKEYIFSFYPLEESIKAFKYTVKYTLKNNLNLSPYYIIHLLNFIIKDWNKYFKVGDCKKFLEMDRFIQRRTWKYLKRKFRKVPSYVLFKKFYQVVKINNERIWQFRGVKRFKNVDVLLFCNLVKLF